MSPLGCYDFHRISRVEINEAVAQAEHPGAHEETFFEKRSLFGAFLLDMKRQILASCLMRREIQERNPYEIATQPVLAFIVFATERKRK